MRRLRIITYAVAAALSLGLVACGGSSSSTQPTTPAGTTSTTTSTATSAPTGNEGTELSLTAPVDAANAGYTEKTLSAPADTPFTITFKNDDAGIPHNVQLFEGTDTTATPVFAPENNELITGVAEAEYDIPALPAGTYTYNCLSHPATMVGTLTVA